MPGRMLSIVLLPGLLVFAGCGPFAFTPKRPPTLDRVHAYDQAALDKDIQDYEAAKGDDATRAGIRTKIVMKIAASIDADYEGFANHFFVDQAWTDTALDIAIIGVGSAGALTGGEAFKAIMSATSAGIAGSRAAVSKNFFKEKSPEIVRARMAALRAKQWAVIYQKLPSPDHEYSLYEAGRDLIVYYNAGTVRAAFDDIAAESGEQAKKGEADLTAEIEDRFGPTLRAPEDRVGWNLLKKRVIDLQHGDGDDNGRPVTIAEGNRDNVACRVLKGFDATEFATCDHGQSKLATLVRTRKDRETIRRLNDAFADVLKTL